MAETPENDTITSAPVEPGVNPPEMAYFILAQIEGHFPIPNQKGVVIRKTQLLSSNPDGQNIPLQYLQHLMARGVHQIQEELMAEGISLAVKDVFVNTIVPLGWMTQAEFSGPQHELKDGDTVAAVVTPSAPAANNVTPLHRP